MPGELEPEPAAVATALRLSVSLLVRRMRQAQANDDLTLPEISALSRLDRGGPTTPSALARLEQITPQSMGATLYGLETRGLVERRGDPADGRRAVMSLTTAGLQMLRHRRNVQTERLAHVMTESFTPTELEQLLCAALLIERLAHGL